MSRKLRFFKDQVNKAGLLSSSRTLLQPDIDLEDLEVTFCFFFLLRHIWLLPKGWYSSYMLSCCYQLCDAITEFGSHYSAILVCSSILSFGSDYTSSVGFVLYQVHLAEHEHELIEMNSNSDKLRQSYNELLEFKIVLQKVILFIENLYVPFDFGSWYLFFLF
jgi:hypothetical protein